MVALSETNRFFGGSIETFEDGTQISVAPDIEAVLANVKDFNLVDLRANQEISAVAYSQYSKIVSDASKYYWVLCVANDIPKAWELEDLVGTELVVPDIIQLKLQR
jgi:hypothetical protein